MVNGVAADIEGDRGDSLVEQQPVAVVGLAHVATVVEAEVDDETVGFVVVHELVQSLIPLLADPVLVLPIPGGDVDVADPGTFDHTPGDVVPVDEVRHLDSWYRQLLVAPDRSPLAGEQICWQADDFFGAVFLDVDCVEEMPIHAGAAEHRVLERAVCASPIPFQSDRQLQCE